MDSLQQQFGNVIRRRRLALGLGQEAFADKAGIHRTHISLLERGKTMPSLLVIKKLATALGTTMTDVISDLERQPAEQDEVAETGQQAKTATTKKLTKPPKK